MKYFITHIYSQSSPHGKYYTLKKVSDTFYPRDATDLLKEYFSEKKGERVAGKGDKKKEAVKDEHG